jgi:hypothetical protein
MTAPVPAEKTGFVANEPVIVSHFVLWLFVNAGAFVVGHTHIVTSAQWDSLTTGLVPVVSAVVLGLIATVVRKYVSPAWKALSGGLSNAGIPVPSNQQLDDIAQQIYESLLVKHAQAEAQAASVPSEDVLAKQVPANAGASSDAPADPAPAQ